MRQPALLDYIVRALRDAAEAQGRLLQERRMLSLQAGRFAAVQEIVKPPNRLLKVDSLFARAAATSSLPALVISVTFWHDQVRSAWEIETESEVYSACQR